MKKLLALVMGALLLCGCAPVSQHQQVTYLDIFDTVTTVTGSLGTQEEFESLTRQVHDQLMEYHRLFDIYNDYSGCANLKTVNDHAGIAPVTVDERVIRLLLDCKEYYELTDGRVNVAMGSVLSLWHDARTAAADDPQNAALPDSASLREAAEHTGWDTVRIDEETCSVYITDPAQTLDVGAVAKGWALQQVAGSLPAGLLINLGGNICATGPKQDETPWTVAVNDPKGGAYLCTLPLNRGSVVTSGDYQRYFSVDGKHYHHIIDPDTLYPALGWSSVTILCDDSGLADALSTALFLLTQEEGRGLLEKCGAQAMWVDKDGNCTFSDGFPTATAE